MKIIFIGDIHGRTIWKAITEKEQFDLVIFAGDYVSTHEDISETQQIDNLVEILEYKEANPDKVILLRGNHDMQHLGYEWAQCTGLFKKVRDWMSQEEVKTQFLNDTQWIYVYDKYLFSHAGVSKTWLGNIPLNKVNELPPHMGFGFTATSLGDRYGTSVTQPPTWIRPQALMVDGLDDYIQIIGHTPVTKIADIYAPAYKKHIWLCDHLPFEYLVIDEQEVFPRFINKPVISLHNRYGLTVYLEYIDNDKWLLKGEDSAMKYIGVSFIGNSILSIDPSGGPYLSEGDTLPNDRKIKIETIEETPNGFVLTLKKNETN